MCSLKIVKQKKRMGISYTYWTLFLTSIKWKVWKENKLKTDVKSLITGNNNDSERKQELKKLNKNK